MYLLIDWGNSRLKYLLVERLSKQAIQSEKTHIQFANSVEDLLSQLQNKLHKMRIDKVLVASVKSEQHNLLLRDSLNDLKLSCSFAQPKTSDDGITLAYKDINKMGVDRWLAMLGAYVPKQSVGIIDLGTAITVDLLSGNGRHLGGHIIPGQQMLSKSLLTTDKIEPSATDSESSRMSVLQNGQEVQWSDRFNLKLGDSTQSCVNFGVEHLIFGYLTEMVTNAQHEFGITHWEITGGDGANWYEHLTRIKNRQFSPTFVLSPKLIFQGLSKLHQ